MKKELTQEEICKKEITSDQEKINSFNRKYCGNDNTKLIIVGTITPFQNAGYFYTSRYNRIFGYIDEAINTHLKEEKKKLYDESSNKDEIIKTIIKTLQDHNIAFLDVINTAIRKKNSSLDKDIIDYSLDYEAFKNIPDNAVLICNSKKAEVCCKDILSKIEKNNHPLYFESQRCGKKTDWIRLISNNL